jgi:hypothetical protein
MRDEDILAEAAKMVLTDKVPEQPYIRGYIMGIAQIQYGMRQMFYNSPPNMSPQVELEVTMRIMVDANDDDKIHRIIHGGRILIMEDRLG